MTRKLTAVIVLTCMLFTMLTPCAYAANAPFYKLIAEEMLTTADYTASGWGQPNVATAYATDASGNYVLTGKGWAANWVVKGTSDTNFREPGADDKVKFYFADVAANRVLKLDSMPSGTFLYRQFAKAFEFGGADGTYSFSIEVQDGSSGAGGSAFRQKIGEAFTVGYDYVQDDATKIVPIIEVGGTKVSAESPLTTTHAGGDKGKFIVFETTVSLNKSGTDTITAKIYEKDTQPNSTVSTTADLTSLIEYVGIGSTGTTLLRIRNLKAEYSNQAAYDRIVNIANNGTTDAAELQGAIADLADYNGADKDTLLAQLKAHATGDLAGVANLKLVSITPDVSAPILVNDAKKFELEYNYPFADGTVFNIYNTLTDEAIAGTVCTINKNKVTLTYEGTLESGIPYAIKATGTDFKGDTISGIPFSISALPEINVSNNAHYTQGKEIVWAEDGNAVVTALLNGQPIQNGDSILVPGEYALSITVTKNGIPETVVLNITIDEDFAPVASNVEIKGTVGAGEVLEADFDYYDENGDAEDEHIIVWYRINGSVETEVGYGPTYTIQRSDRNSDIVVGVTPKSKSVVNPVGEEVFSDPIRCVFVPTDIATDAFYELVAEDTISTTDYSVAQTGAGGNITKSYTIDPNTGKPILTGKGWLANWVVKGAADFGFRALLDSDNVWYYSVSSDNKVIKLNNMPTDVTLYRQLAQPIEFGNTNDKFSFKIDVQDGSSSAGGSKFRFKIGDSIVAGYDYASDNTKIIPVLEVNGTAVPNSDTLTMGNGGDGGKFMTLTVIVELTQDGADTVTLIAHEKGAAANAARVMIATGAELSGNCEYVGIGTVPGATTLLRVDNLKIEYSNIGRFYEITDIANNGTTDAAKLEAAIADLADYNGADKATLLAQLKAHATGGLAGVADVKHTSISHDVSKMLLVRDVNSFEIKYNYKLNDDVTFGIYNADTNEAVPEVTSDVNGTDVEITIPQKLENGIVYEIRATGTDFKGDIIPAIEFKTSPIPDTNIVDGANYSELTEIYWNADENTTVTAVLKDASGNENPVSNGDRLVIGAFEFTITASKNGLSDTAVMNITVEEDIAPVASNVKITGIAATDAVLQAGFDFYDVNGDAEGSHIIVWYKNTADGKVEIGRGTTYTLKAADENSDIIVGVTPVAISNVKSQGEEVLSEAFKGAYKPVATDAKITGVIEEGKELDVSYTFSDINGDEKGTPVVKWYITGENGDTEIVSNITDGKLTITSDLFEKYVYAKLTPVSTKKPYNGDEVTTVAVLMPSAPTVSNVRIEGSASAGSVLTAYYSFDDPNLDAEGISKFEWKDSAGNVIGRERKLTVTNSMVGKTITVTVIGVSEKTPSDSTPVTSAPFTVSGGSSSGVTGGVVSGGGGFGYSGGSSGSSGGSSGGSGSSGTTTPVTPVVPETPTQPEAETVFGDVYGHWSQEYVTVLLEKGIVTKDENFRPDDSISRAEMLAMLFRSAGIELSAYNGAYGDVQSGDWFADYIQTALDAGIISPDDNFRPNDSITREEAAKIIAIMLKLTSEADADFADADAISDWATEFVNAVYEAGIFKGDENGNFNAKGALTRAETATVIFRLLEANAFNDGGAE